MPGFGPLACTLLLAFCAQAQAPALRLHELRSEIFQNTRIIRVWLPPGYDDAENRNRRYPVLYLNDGQNLFDVETSIFNRMEWRADETAARLLAEGRIEPLILVGIDTVGRRGRATEYLPYEDKYLEPPEPEPRGAEYPRFVVQEVMPLVNRTYRTRTGPEHTGFGGSSYGAVAALYTVMERPDIFGRLLLESPSLYIAEGRLLEDAEMPRQWPRRVYLGVGTNESGAPQCPADGETREAVRDVRRLERILLAAGQPQVLTVVEACAVHNEEAWAQRLPRALEFLFPAHPRP